MTPSGPETRFGNRLRTLLERAGGQTYKAHGGRYSRAGWPDLWIGHPAWSGWLELKTDDGVLAPLQVATIRKIRKAGSPAGVLRPADLPARFDLEDLIAALHDAAQRDVG